MAPTTTTTTTRFHIRREAETFRFPPLKVVVGLVCLIAMLSGLEEANNLSVCNAFVAKTIVPLRTIAPTKQSFSRERFDGKGMSASPTDTEDAETSLAGANSEPPAGETITTTTTNNNNNKNNKNKKNTITTTTRAHDDDPRSAAAPTPFWNRLESMVFGFLDGDATISESEPNDEDPRLVLAHWVDLWECDENENHEKSTDMESETAVQSLEHFLEVWAQTTLSNDRGLTTPVSCTKFRVHAARGARAATPGDNSALGNNDNHNNHNHNHNNNDNNHNNDNDNDNNPRSMKLIFRPPKRYLSYKEQKSMEKGVLPDRKGGKVDAWSPGGVEITVSTTTKTKTTTKTTKTTTKTTTMRSSGAGAGAVGNRKLVGVMVRRCDIDGDTVVKKTTERAIVRRLEDALRIWKTNRARKRQYY